MGPVPRARHGLCCLRPSRASPRRLARRAPAVAGRFPAEGQPRAATTAASVRSLPQPTTPHTTPSRLPLSSPPFLFEAPVFPKPLLPAQARIPVPLAVNTRLFRGCTDAHT